MAKVSVTGFVERMKKAKAAKKRTVKVAQLKPPTRKVSGKTRFKNLQILQVSKGITKLVCLCQSILMAEALTKLLNENAKTGVKFFVMYE